MSRPSHFFIAVLSSVVVAAGALGQSFPTSGLIAYYPFDGNANDASGNGFDATVAGATLTTNRFGEANSAYYFDGTSSAITLPLPLLQQLGGSAPISVSAWFYTPSDSHTALLSFGAANPGQAFELDLVSGTFIYTQIGGGNVNSPTFVADGQWHQGVFVDDGSSTTLYVDGKPTATGTVASNRGSTGGLIGSNLGGGWFWQGGIDDVRFYNRALSSNEVSALYTYESAPPGPCLPHSALATAVVTNGFVIGATIVDSGCGYTNNPLVLIQNGGGTGAAATAVVSNGVVVKIVITDAGRNYTGVPSIYIYSPLGWQIGLIKAVVPTFSDLLVGTNYQLQASLGLNNWTNEGTPFTATNPVMVYPQYFNVTNWEQLYFRLEVVP